MLLQRKFSSRGILAVWIREEVFPVVVAFCCKGYIVNNLALLIGRSPYGTFDIHFPSARAT